MSGMTGRDYAALAPEIFLLIGAVLTLIGGSFIPRARQGITRWTAIGSAGASAISGVILGMTGRGAQTIFDGSYALDIATTSARVIVPLGVILVIALGRDEFGGAARESETYSLLLLASLGTVLLAGAGDLLVLAAAYLLATIPLYGLIGLSRSAAAAEASLKTYLLGALLGTTMLLGISVLYGIGGATEYRAWSDGARDAPIAALALGFVALFAGLLFKAGGVPGHFWVPDASQASGISVAAFVTSIPKVGAMLALLRLVDLTSKVNLPLLIALVAALSMTVGNLAAFWQSDVRRLLGWSTVSQVGYLMMPIVAGATIGSGPLAVYLGGYVLTNLVAFAVAAALPERARIEAWAGAAGQHPWLTGALVVGLLSLVGTPPTVVFFGKLAVFTAAWEGGYSWLVVVAAANTAASLFYYLRWIAAVFRADAEPRSDGRSPQRTSVIDRVSRPAAVVALGGAALVLVLGVVGFALLGALTVPLA